MKPARLDRFLVVLLLLVAAFATGVGHDVEAPHLVAAGHAGVMLGLALVLSMALDRRGPAHRRRKHRR